MRNAYVSNGSLFRIMLKFLELHQMIGNALSFRMVERRGNIAIYRVKESFKNGAVNVSDYTLIVDQDEVSILGPHGFDEMDTIQAQQGLTREELGRLLAAQMEGKGVAA